MGEKIKVLSVGKLLGADFEVELNHPLSKGGRRQVHIQSEKFRVEMDLEDYIVYALSVLSAEKKLRILKRIKQ